MRNRIFAAVGVAALATVGLAAPASAVSDTTADLWIVHAFPDDALGDGFDSDVTININDGDLVLDGVEPGAVAPQVDLPAATYAIEITREADGTVVFDDSVELEAGVSYTAVAHPNVANDGFVLSTFVNDISTIDAGEGKITVRHTAGVGGVDVRSGDTVVVDGLENPNEGTLELAAGVVADVNVVPTGGDTRVIDLGDVTLDEGQHIFVHAFGPQTDETFSAILFDIEGLHSTPDGIPGGSAGLVSEGSPLGLGAGIAGALALMLLIAGAVVATRRNTASAER